MAAAQLEDEEQRVEWDGEMRNLPLPSSDRRGEGEDRRAELRAGEGVVGCRVPRHMCPEKRWGLCRAKIWKILGGKVETHNRAVETLAREGRKPLWKKRKKIPNSCNCSNLKVEMLLEERDFRSFG